MDHNPSMHIYKLAISRKITLPDGNNLRIQCSLCTCLAPCTNSYHYTRNEVQRCLMGDGEWSRGM